VPKKLQCDVSIIIVIPLVEYTCHCVYEAMPAQMHGDVHQGRVVVVLVVVVVVIVDVVTVVVVVVVVVVVEGVAVVVVAKQFL